MYQRRREDIASDSNSPKAHRHEGYLENLQKKAGNVYADPLYICRVVLLLLNACPGRAAGGSRRGAVPQTQAALRRLKSASVPPRSYGQQLDLVEGSLPQGA
jgi:hypothetical protein